MISLLSSPKVRLALIVNGLYFVSLFTPSAPHRRPSFFERARAIRDARAETLADYELRRPATADDSGFASSYVSGGQLQVSLKKDLTLVEDHGRTLTLSPSFIVSTEPGAKPDFVTLNFITFSEKGGCPGDCPLTITADGVTVWTSYSHGRSPGWERASTPYSTSLVNGKVVETLAAESLSTKMSYDNFIDMLNADRVTIRLGPHWVVLKPEQLEALRDMHRRLL